MEGTSSTWTPDPYDISRTPSFISVLNTPPNQGHRHDFPRSAKWCADGSTVIAQTESGKFQRYDVASQDSESPTQDRFPAQEFPQAAPVLDFVWYPTATPRDPASFCFVASVRECPVKLLDASDGRLRASYKIVDHRERFIAPHSLAFNLTAQKLYCGFEDAIEVFDLSRPGEGTRISTTPNKKSKDGLKGIISALAFSPSYTAEEAFYAAGSFTPTPHNIGLFSDAQAEPLMYVGGGPRAGVTQLQFNPMQPHILYAGYRGHASGMIYSWDIRANVDAPLEIFRKSPSSTLASTQRSNQRMHFDVDVAGRLLSVGDQDGSISVFELDGGNTLENADVSLVHESSNDGLDTKVTLPKLRFKAHEDAVGSVAFHPFKSILLSASGSWHFLKGYHEEEADDEFDDGDVPRDRLAQGPQLRPVALDSTMKIWDLREQRSC
ncbi:WD40-repeat-containing domain protein [Pholiota molesta]|nr:WD40-repeat-containing domain protein [Pholiota molesta]